MESEVIDWIVRGMIGAVIAAVAGLFAWQRRITADVAVLTEKVRSAGGGSAREAENAKAVQELSAGLQELRISLLENYVRRDDYVSQISLFGRKLDSTAEMVMRMDERLKNVSREVCRNE